MRCIAMLFAVLLSCVLVIAPAAAQVLPGSLVSIPTSDGYQLQAYVAVPAGPGPFPLVVMPSSWAESDSEYVGEANSLAGDGFIVISYSSRGFGFGCALEPQCGYIDIAGPSTVGDASTVIDWALANTPADPSEIGISGISYGGGASLLAAERDPRIKAVAALSTWADLPASLDANQTPSSQGIGLLSLASHLGKPGSLMQQLNAKVDQLDFRDAVDVMLADPNTPGRSASNGIGMLNANAPAVLLANAFEDSLFVPGQLVDFYNRLTVPKMLLLSHGDHTTAEMGGAQGFPNEIYAAVNAWFEHYLEGVSNGIDLQSPVQLKSQAGQWRGFADWNAVQQNAVVYALTKPTGLFGILPTGSLSPAGGASWQYGIGGGVPTAATTGVAFLSGALTGYLDLPPPVELAFIDRAHAAVWTGPVLAQTQNLLGMPSLQLTVTPANGQFTLIAYLYSVDPLTGVGQLISWKPYTVLDAAVGAARTINMRLEATNWEIPAGHQLALVVDTSDIRYAGATMPGSELSFSSSAAMPSTLTVSMH